MKKISTLLISLLMMIPATSVTTACSDDDGNTEDILPADPEGDDSDGSNDDGKGNDESGNVIPGVSPEMIEKISKIYDSASTGPQQIKSVNSLAIITSLCASRTVDGPISVTEATLNDEPLTLVTLGGTEEKDGQATTMQESQLAAFGKPNDYLTALTNLFDSGTIPQDRPVMVTGISLGGMIAQQLLMRSDIIEKFDVKAIITFGSPLTLPLNRHGVRVVRFADVNDKVPQLGEMMLRGGMVSVDNMSKEEIKTEIAKLDDTEKISRQSRYTEMIATHALSYIEDPCWSDVDFLGDKPGTNLLVLKEEMKFYPAPKTRQ